MNLGVYVHYVNRFVMMYNRLPSLEEQQKAKQDFDENKTYNLPRRISDTLRTNKPPCERCKDYFAYKAYGTQDDFMQGTFKNRNEAELISSSSLLAYQPLTPLGSFSTVADKQVGIMQYKLLSDEELTYQVTLYNTLELTSSASIDEQAFSLQLMLWFNPELVCKPHVEYQYALLYKMLRNQPATQYARVVERDGTVSRLRIAQMLAAQAKGTVTFTGKDLDDVVQRIARHSGDTIQSGLMAFDLDMESVHMQAEMAYLDAINNVLRALQGLSTADLMLLQRAKSESELRDAVRQVALRLGQLPAAQDQPVPEQYFELSQPYEPESVRGYRQILALVFYIKKLCTGTRQIVPFMPAANGVAVNESNGAVSKVEPVPSALRSGRRWILPYVEYVVSEGTIKNLSDNEIVRQVRLVFAK